jgi:uncharacterized membrane protein
MKAYEVAKNSFGKKIDAFPDGVRIRLPEKRLNLGFRFVFKLAGVKQDYSEINGQIEDIRKEVRLFMQEYREVIDESTRAAALNLLEVVSKSELNTAEIITAQEKLLNGVIHGRQQLEYNTVHYIRSLVTQVKKSI